MNFYQIILGMMVVELYHSLLLVSNKIIIEDLKTFK